MPRGLDSSLITELAKDDFNLCSLLFMDIGNGIRLTDYAHDITYSSNTYSASDHLLSIGAPKETRDLRVNTLTVTLSGVEQTYITLMLTNDYVNRPVQFYKAAISASGAIIGSPMLAFDGRMTRFEIREGSGTSEVSIEVASHWADFEKKAGRRTNTNSHQRFFPSDKGFDFAAKTVRDLRWGKK